MREPIHSNTIAGWREWVSLPGFKIPWMKAKLDTGARSSALHAFDIVEFRRGGHAWVRFSVHPWQESEADAATVEAPVHDRRAVRSSSGHSAVRIVVLMDVVLMDEHRTVETTLTNRDEMGFRMLIGREALQQGFLVDASSSFLGGRAPRMMRRRNRGH